MARVNLNSTDTALCLLPPNHLWPPIDRLRSLYDPAYGSWPPHINILYPFVRRADLSNALDLIASAVKADAAAIGCLRICLDANGVFTHKDGSNTLYLGETDQALESTLARLRNSLLSMFDLAPDSRPSKLHMTIGKAGQGSEKEFLSQKVAFLPPVSWEDTSLVILVRESKVGTDEGRCDELRTWGRVDLETGSIHKYPDPLAAYGLGKPDGEMVPRPAYRFLSRLSCWAPWDEVPDSAQQSGDGGGGVPESLVVASYNVLAEFSWPPDRRRYPRLVETLMQKNSKADILVLQEVTDDFLPLLLGNADIRLLYPFVTHGPPDQGDVEPLSNMVNVVVLSRYPFRWHLLPLKRRHKSSPILEFPGIGAKKKGGSQNELVPLVLAGCHLTQGLTDGAVVAKKNELSAILRHLVTSYPESPLVLAGDFNIATSSYTIRTARDSGSITAHTYRTLDTFEVLLSEAGMEDAWVVARCVVGESSSVVDNNRLLGMFEGEQGATFNPTDNPLAVAGAGNGLNNRPQRYDRILVKTHGLFDVRGFNTFGLPRSDPDGSPASDHWGVRCLLTKRHADYGIQSIQQVELKKADSSLGDPDLLRDCLLQRGCWPSEEDRTARQSAIQLLGDILLTDNGPQPTGDQTTTTLDGGGGERRSTSSKVILVPVGSFGLGVWTGTSDIDCLCTGPFSPSTFFSIATRKLKKAAAASLGVRIIRKVKANTGTMLELEILGIKADLQYCQSRYISENWSEVMRRPASDPVFSLSSQQTLLKLKPARDMTYLLRSMPDQVQFRTAYLLLRAWARARGIYASKFGYLGGISLAVLLVRVCKAAVRVGTTVSTADIVASFFAHYARIDWSSQVIFDPYFHQSMRYARTFREPLCILGWHGPSLNTTPASSGPTVKTIAAELSRANAVLSQPAMTWKRFVGAEASGQDASKEFLATYKSYVTLDVNYWGQSPQKGRMFVGWLESRCVTILVDIDRKIPGLFARFWPSGFNANDDTPEDGSGFRKRYLIGLRWDAPEDGRAPAKRAEDDIAIAAAKASLYVLLSRFEERIRRDEKYYSAKTCYFQAAVVPSSQVRDLVLGDEAVWDYDAGEDISNESDSDDDDDDDDDDMVAEEGVQSPSIMAWPSPVVSAAPVTARGPEGRGKKLRPAIDVLNRIRWDGEVDEGDFVIGYEDRFAGVMEKPLSQWKNEQTDEEFIPQHRIVYFKRKPDGAVVWDRRQRKDTMFGSGSRDLLP